MRFAILGAGNGGQSMAGYLAMTGQDVVLYDISKNKIDELRLQGGIILEGKVSGFGKVNSFTTDIASAVKGADIVMITTTANAHIDIARSMAPYIEDGQVIILNPGRTCGALVFKQTLIKAGCTKRYYLGEAQTLIYACRLVKNGTATIIGIKDEVYLAGLPSTDTPHILKKISPVYPCFKPVPNVLYTGFENIGAMLHPCVCLFNAATIERQEQFWFYRDMTEQIARFIEQFDAERLAVGNAYGIKLNSVNEWIKVAYKDTEGETLLERIKNNPAYYAIKSPGTIFSRQLTEDIPTGVLPIIELGKVAGIESPLLQSMVTIVEALLGQDLHTNGRSLKNLGLEGMSKQEILKYISNED